MVTAEYRMYVKRNLRNMAEYGGIWLNLAESGGILRFLFSHYLFVVLKNKNWLPNLFRDIERGHVRKGEQLRF